MTTLTLAAVSTFVSESPVTASSSLNVPSSLALICLSISGLSPAAPNAVSGITQNAATAKANTSKTPRVLLASFVP